MSFRSRNRNRNRNRRDSISRWDPRQGEFCPARTVTPSNHDEHTPAIAAALRELERRLDLLVQALSHESAPVSVEGARTDREARRLVCEAYATIDYAPDDQANESPVCLGVIGGSASPSKTARAAVS